METSDPSAQPGISAGARSERHKAAKRPCKPEDRIEDHAKRRCVVVIGAVTMGCRLSGSAIFGDSNAGGGSTLCSRASGRGTMVVMADGIGAFAGTQLYAAEPRLG